MNFLDRVLKAPIITEKGTLVTEKGNQVVFHVDCHSTKREVATAVEKLFGVKVTSVRTLNTLGKVYKSAGRNIGRHSTRKKAYVTLAEGHSIDLLEQV
jgi:large subunit ribosomal protein L23